MSPVCVPFVYDTHTSCLAQNLNCLELDCARSHQFCEYTGGPDFALDNTWLRQLQTMRSRLYTYPELRLCKTLHCSLPSCWPTLSDSTLVLGWSHARSSIQSVCFSLLFQSRPSFAIWGPCLLCSKNCDSRDRGRKTTNLWVISPSLVLPLPRLQLPLLALRSESSLVFQVLPGSHEVSSLLMTTSTCLPVIDPSLYNTRHQSSQPSTKLPDTEPTRLVIRSSQTAKRTTEAKRLNRLLKSTYKLVFWPTPCSPTSAGQPTAVFCLLRILSSGFRARLWIGLDRCDRRWNRFKFRMLECTWFEAKDELQRDNFKFPTPK